LCPASAAERGRRRNPRASLESGALTIAAWAVVYYDPLDPADSPVAFLDNCPAKVDAGMTAVLGAIAAAPPPQFSGGGYWEAMHGKMTGYFEVRKQGPNREQFRLFCILENSQDKAELEKTGLPGPVIAVLTGMRKPFGTVFSDADYQHVRELGESYRNTFPRRIVTPTDSQ